MEINRRHFLKAAAGATSLMLLQPSSLALAEEAQTHAGVAMLIDVTKCVNCWWCYAACKEYNNLPETYQPDVTQPPELSPTVWTMLHPVQTCEKWVSRKTACNHCTEAACVDVCPTGALSYNKMGFVQYDKEKCSGCGYCAEACPFGVPQLEANKVTGVAIMDKCTFCHDRVTNGEPPACAAACTTGAIKYGKRFDLITEAGQRVTALRQNNINASLYGVDELHGLHVMYILDDSPEAYGLPINPQVPAAVTVRDILRWVGSGAAIAAVAGFGLNYLIAKGRMSGGEK